MVPFGMVSLIENQQVYLIHPNVGIQKALVQNFRCANYHHVIFEIFSPGLLVP